MGTPDFSQENSLFYYCTSSWIFFVFIKFRFFLNCTGPILVHNARLRKLQLTMLDALQKSPWSITFAVTFPFYRLHQKLKILGMPNISSYVYPYSLAPCTQVELATGYASGHSETCKLLSASSDFMRRSQPFCHLLKIGFIACG